MNFKKFNIFTFLMIVSVFAFGLRLVNVASFSTQASVAADHAPDQKFEPVAKEAAATKPAEKPVVTESNATPPPEPTPADKHDNDSTGAAPPSPYGEQGYSASEVEMLQSLSKRRDELDKREQQIGQREAILKAAGAEVDRKIAELTKIRSQLEDLLGSQKTAEDERITSLVKIYENMKPKDAANIFNTLDMSVLLPVISKMKEQKTSPILAAMDADKARAVTIKLAEQRKLPELPADPKKAKPGAPKQ